MHLTILQQVERLKRMTGEYKWNSTSTGNKIKGLYDKNVLKILVTI